MAAVLVADGAVRLDARGAALRVRRNDRRPSRSRFPRVPARRRLEIHRAVCRPTRSPPTTASPSPPPPAPSSTSRASSRPAARAGGDGGGDPQPRAVPPPSTPSSRATPHDGDEGDPEASGGPRHRPQRHETGAGAPLPRLPRRPRLPARRSTQRSTSIPSRRRSTASGPITGSSPSSTASRPTARAGVRGGPRRDRALLVAGYRVTRITWRQVAEQPNALASEPTTLLDQPGNRR